MTYVRVADLKSAVRIAAAKQLAANGFTVTPNSRGLVTSWKGKGAWTTYTVSNASRWNPEICDYEKLPGYNYHATINYPALPNGAGLTRAEADLFAGYTLHEIGHILFTDNRVVSSYGIYRNPFLKSIWNGLEDPREEASLIATGNARGARDSLTRVAAYILREAHKNGWNPNKRSSVPFTLAILGRVRLWGLDIPGTNNILDRCEPKVAAFYSSVLDRLAKVTLGRDGNKELCELAIAAYNELRAIGKPAEEPEPINPEPDNEPEEEPEDTPEGDEPNDAPEGDGEEAGDEGEVPDIDGLDEDLEDADEDDTDFDDGDFEDEYSEDDDANDYGDDGYADESDEDESDEDESEEGGEGGEDDDADDADDGEGDEGDEDANSDEPFEEGDFGNGSGNDPSDTIDPDPDISKKADRIRKRNKTTLRDAADPVPVPSPQDYDLADLDSKYQNSQEGIERALARIPDAKSAVLQQQLLRLLDAPERTGWYEGYLSGRFDTRRTGRACAGSDNVFKRRWETEGVDTAVLILLDNSGSMDGSPLYTVKKLTDAMARIFERINGVALKVTGFTSAYSRNYWQTDPTTGIEDKPSKAADPAAILTFKDWNVRYNNSKSYLIPLAAIGGTPDYAAVVSAIEELRTRPEKRKLLFVLTDGYGDNPDGITKACIEAEKADITVVGLGIQVPVDQYPNRVLVRDLDSLSAEAFRGVVKAFEQRKAA